MWKAAGAIMTGAACVFMGIKKSTLIRKRLKYLINLQKALEILETKIDFLHRDIKTALEEINPLLDTGGLISEVVKNMEHAGVAAAWSFAVNKKADALCFNAEDKDTVLMLAPRLGMTDVKNQIDNIEYVKNMLDIHIKSAQYDVKTRCRLYSGCGILTGIFLIFMFI